jgi:hypothetical protein
MESICLTIGIDRALFLSGQLYKPEVIEQDSSPARQVKMYVSTDGILIFEFSICTLLSLITFV